MNPDLLRFDAFLFDMGNTLLDFHASGPSDTEKDRIGIERFAQQCNTRFGLRLSPQDCQARLFDPWNEYLERERKQRLLEQDFEKLVETFLETVGVTPAPSDAFQLAAAFHSPHAEHVVVNPGALSCLARLKTLGKKVCVISNCALPEALFIRIFEEQGLGPFIDSYHFSYTHKRMKPHPTLFQQALSACGCLPQNALMIGDSYKADIQGAKRIGCGTCLYGKTGLLPEADYQITSFDDLLRLLD